MKDKILAALRAKHKNVHADLLDRVAGTMAKTVTKEEDIDAAVTAQDEFIKEMADYSQKETDRRVTEALKKAKDDKKDDNPDPDKDKDKDKKDKTNDKDVPEWAKSLIESNKALSEKLQAIEGEKVTQTLSQKLVEGLKGKQVPESFYKTAIAGRTFKDEAEVDGLIETVSTGYTEHLTELQKINPGMGRPQRSTQSNDAVPEAIKEKAQSVKEGAKPAAEGLIGKQLQS